MGSFRRNIQRIKKTLVLDFSADDNQIISDAFDINGILRRVVFVVPELTSTNTATLTLKDVDGNTVYTDATVAENTTANETTDLAVSGDHTLTVDTSGAQDADRTFTVVLYVER